MSKLTPTETTMETIINVLFGQEFNLYTQQDMINKVFKIIKENPLDESWKEKNKEFLFEEIVAMCKRAGYQLILHKRI